MVLGCWDPDTLPENFSLGIIAKRRSGKSTLVKYLCWKHWRKEFPFVMVCTDTLYNQYYQDFIPEKDIHAGYQEKLINGLIERQIRLKTAMAQYPKSKRENIKTLLILDDVTEVNHSKSLARLLLQGRHLEISIIVSIQDATLIDRTKRDQLDCVISMRQANKVSRERIIDSYLAVNSWRDGDEVLKEGTNEEFKMLVIDNTTTSYNLPEFCCQFKIPELPPKKFAMGNTRKYMWMYDTEIEELETAMEEQTLH